MLKKLFSLFLSFALALTFTVLPQTVPEAEAFSYSEVAAYSDEPYIEINGNVPEFEPDEYTYSSFETYSALDELGRCGEAYACVGQDLMPTEERGAIGSVKPTGWHSETYDFISGKYLYNRCHLIGFQLTGENANRQNLITGTRYLNIDGMLPFENEVAGFVEETGYHVLYRVTPVFIGDELVARGVLIEALSMEDGGAGVCFCVFCYNVQPGVDIDYYTGESREYNAAPQNRTYTYVVGITFAANTNTMKYHMPDCSSAVSMSEKNRRDINATAERMEEMGYTPCSRCRPDEQVKTVSYYYGDADLDGTITPGDARLTLRAAVGLEFFDTLRSALCDTDSDSAVTSADARIILRAAVGLQFI